MKIGIITIHNVINYGALLQAYGLLKYIRNTHPEDTVQIIDYMPAYFSSVKGAFRIVNIRNIRTFLIELESLLTLRSYNRREKTFRNFLLRENILTADYTDIKNFQEHFDILISGSDQIWNKSVTGHKPDPAYFLDFGAENAGKIAYASSLGGYTYSGSESEQVKQMLLGYDALSCRERDGAEYVRSLTGRECTHVIDPTFLLTAEEWCKESADLSEKVKRLAEKNYIFIYSLNNNPALFEAAQCVSQKTGFPVYQCARQLRKLAGVDKLLPDLSPAEFLYLVKHAQYVITNSFHGTCFSVNFSRNFFTVLSKSRTSRITSLLSRLGLEKQIVSSTEDIPLSPIDYNIVQKKLDAFRKESQVYLNSAINAVKTKQENKNND